MHCDNKQNKSSQLNLTNNSIQNGFNNLFSNPYINQKIHKRQDMMQIYNQQDYEQQDKQDEHNINDNKNMSNTQTNNKSNNNKRYGDQHKINTHICKKHMKQFTNLFCSQCLTYNICRSCIPSFHSQHQILQFNSQSQMLNDTKQILLQNLQQTLQQLKSKENQIKNRVHQVNLIRNSLKSLQEDIVACISNMFRDMQGQLMALMQKKQQEFGKDLDQFFRNFNQVNDQLRDNLMNILDGKIDIVEFDKKMICKQAPTSPSFQNYKNTLQKYKKVLRDVKAELVSTKKIIEQGYQNIIGNNKQMNCKNSNIPQTKKFDKYIETNLNKGEKASQSFIKTLKLIQNVGHNKENGGLLARKII